MSHGRLRFLFIGTKHFDQPLRRLPKPRVCIHRPPDADATYRLIRTDGKPATDDDWETVHTCNRCYPVKKHEITDHRKTS